VEVKRLEAGAIICYNPPGGRVVFELGKDEKSLIISSQRIKVEAGWANIKSRNPLQTSQLQSPVKSPMMQSYPRLYRFQPFLCQRLVMVERSIDSYYGIPLSD